MVILITPRSRPLSLYLSLYVILVISGSVNTSISGNMRWFARALFKWKIAVLKKSTKGNCFLIPDHLPIISGLVVKFKTGFILFLLSTRWAVLAFTPWNTAAICKQQLDDIGDFSKGLCILMKGLLWHLQIYYISQMLPYWRLICLFQKGQLPGMNAPSSMMSGHAAAQVIPLFYF